MTEDVLVANAGNLEIRLRLAPKVRIVSHGRKESKTRYAQMLQDTLENPIDFPSLMLAILEDDQIAIALEEGVPDGERIAAYLIEYLLQHGTRSENICLILAGRDGRSQKLAEAAIRHLSLPAIRIVCHDPNEIDSHAYVAASETADAIYVQRELVDADVVMPIYCARIPECPYASDLFGISPSFTDAETQYRWSKAWLEDNITHLHQHEKLSQEAGWLVGIHFTIAVVPSLDGHVSEILAGKPQSVFERSTASLVNLGEEIYDLVIAVVDGSEEQQDWMSIARAASQAEILCRPEGRIVVCCNVKHTTRGIRDLASDAPTEEANRRLLQSHFPDSFPAAVLRTIRDHRTIYLLSSMQVTETEKLGLAFVQSAELIDHLIQQAERVCIIRGAQY